MSAPEKALDFPATARNREPIARVLREIWDPVQTPRRFLEVASGSGQHAAFLASQFPHWTFQPSDLEEAHLESIAAYREQVGLETLLPPIKLDVSARPWPLNEKFDGVLAINLIHIAPWACTEHLLCGSREVLHEGGRLYLYGAFRRSGLHTAPSNQAFDDDLKSRNPEWGVRCLDQVLALARATGFELERVVEMPANNLSVVLRVKAAANQRGEGPRAV